jgi:hypothetical protein
MDESVQLDPKVKISDLDFSLLPLRNFHIVVVVEPDPETWAMPDDDTDNLFKLLNMYSELIIDDAIGDVDPSAIAVPIPDDVKKTFLIMAGEGFGSYYHFEPIVRFSDFMYPLSVAER